MIGLVNVVSQNFNEDDCNNYMEFRENLPYEKRTRRIFGEIGRFDDL